MNYQQKIEFLRGYRTAKENAETYLRQIDDLRDTMLPGGVNISDMPKHPNFEDKMADYAGEFWEIQQRLNKSLARQMHVVAVINQIAESDPLGHRILTERYVNLNRKGYVCRKLHISADTEWRHHKKAVEELDIDLYGKARRPATKEEWEKLFDEGKYMNLPKGEYESFSVKTT